MREILRTVTDSHDDMSGYSTTNLKRDERPKACVALRKRTCGKNSSFWLHELPLLPRPEFIRPALCVQGVQGTTVNTLGNLTWEKRVTSSRGSQ